MSKQDFKMKKDYITPHIKTSMIMIRGILCASKDPQWEEIPIYD